MNTFFFDFLLNYTFSDEYMQSISKTTKRMIVITYPSVEMISEESKKYWGSVSEQLISNETVESVRIESGMETVCRKIGPFLEFMLNFDLYCFNK